MNIYLLNKLNFGPDLTAWIIHVTLYKAPDMF
jgi:hypothetical protein